MSKISLKFLFCDLEKEFIQELKRHLEDVFSFEVDISYLSLDIAKAYDIRRNQYLASIILQQVQRFKENPKEKWLLIVDVDLFAHGLNFIFGQADPRSGIGIISLVRLRPEFYKQKINRSLFLERILKEAVHELGHLFYLSHCENPQCVMHFSNSILDTDKKAKYFCSHCKSFLKTITLCLQNI